MTKSDLANEIYKVAHLTGTFKLRSGQTSSEYFDKYRFESHPKLLKAIAEHMVPLIPKDTEVLAALEMGGIPVGTALSLLSSIPVCFVRKAAKTYGTEKFAEGIDIKDRKVCIIEDVITTGGQVIQSGQDLQTVGAKIDSVLCVINRGGDSASATLGKQGLRLISLFSRSDFP